MTGSIGALTACSRVLGLVREILMSYVLGASLMTDAFIVAFKFPNFFRRFFAEGAFNAAFVPYITRLLASNGEEETHRAVNHIFSGMVIFLFGFVVFVLVFTPWCIPMMAPGFASTPERLNWAIFFTRLTFPYILFVSLAALLAGVLNTRNRFYAGASAPIILNVFMIGALGYALYNPDHAGTWLAISVTIAGVAQVTWLYAQCYSRGVAPRICVPRWRPYMKLVVTRMIPGMFGSGVMQINIFCDMILASFLPLGSLSFLYYADRLIQLPLSMFGVALGTVLLPALSKFWRQGQLDEAHTTQNEAILFGLQMSLPAALGLIILSYPLVDMIFHRGAFQSEHVQATQAALWAFSLGLPAYVLGKVWSAIYFANEDTLTPVKASMMSISLNLVLNLILMTPLKHVGLAIATSISAWFYNIILCFWLSKSKTIRWDRVVCLQLIKIILAAIGMGGALLGALACFPYPLHAGFFERIMHLILMITLGIGVYAIFNRGLGLPLRHDLKR